MQRLATTVQADLPVAAAKLQNGIIQLEKYVTMGVPIEQTSAAIEAGADASGTAPPDGASMKRAEADEVEEPVKPVEETEPKKTE